MTNEQREIMLRGLQIAAARMRRENMPSVALDIEDATAEIERLTAENARLRDGLAVFANPENWDTYIDRPAQFINGEEYTVDCEPWKLAAALVNSE